MAGFNKCMRSFLLSYFSDPENGTLFIFQDNHLLTLNEYCFDTLPTLHSLPPFWSFQIRANLNHCFWSNYQLHGSQMLVCQQLYNMFESSKPPWPNGQGVGLLIRRLRVRVSQEVLSASCKWQVHILLCCLHFRFIRVFPFLVFWHRHLVRKGKLVCFAKTWQDPPTRFRAWHAELNARQSLANAKHFWMEKL